MATEFFVLVIFYLLLFNVFLSLKLHDDAFVSLYTTKTIQRTSIKSGIRNCIIICNGNLILFLIGPICRLHFMKLKSKSNLLKNGLSYRTLGI